jgi:glycosyltransferase involved in cell wall biosynthesis
MACGCPILTTPTGYGYDIKESLPEFVAESLDIQGFLEKKEELTINRKRYSKRALDYFWQFHDPDKFKSNWISLVEGL